tara:strand:+ start:73 stop:366 length:294 start_codon:yes stop_codon:yes gene_type:complete
MTIEFSARELALIADTDVLAHIRARNAAMAEKWDIYTPHLECAASNYENVYEWAKNQAIDDYYDAFDEINGFPPEYNEYTETTLEEIESLTAELVGE